MKYTQIIKKYTLVTSLLVFITSCSENNIETSQVEKIFVEPHIEFQSGKNNYSYPYQYRNYIVDAYNRQSNPDSIVLFYSIKFDSPGLMQLTFFKSFLIDSLENDASRIKSLRDKGYYKGFFSSNGNYSPSDKEILKLFKIGKYRIAEHDVNRSPALITPPSNGVSLHHYKSTKYDTISKTNKYHQKFKSIENASNYFEISDLNKLTLENFKTNYDDWDLDSTTFEFNKVYSMKGSFKIILRDTETQQTELAKSKELTFVIWLKKDKYRKEL